MSHNFSSVYDLINLKLQQFKFNDEMHLIPMFNSILL